MRIPCLESREQISKRVRVGRKGEGWSGKGLLDRGGNRREFKETRKEEDQESEEQHERNGEGVERFQLHVIGGVEM